MLLAARPGDVLAVWTGESVVDDAIRIGDLLEGKPAVANHVIGITHQDKLGRWIGIAGQPGGVALQDCTPFLSDSRTRSNHFMERTDEDNIWLCAKAADALGIKYDWIGGIGGDLADAMNMDLLRKEIDKIYQWPTNTGLLPGHVVCSSLWAKLYQMRALAYPPAPAVRVTTPGDWWMFNNKFPQVDA